MGDFDDLPRGNLAYRLIPVAVDLGNVRAGDSLVFIEGVNKIIAVHTGTLPVITQASRPTVVPLQLAKPDAKPRPVTDWNKPKDWKKAKKGKRGWTRIPEIDDARILAIFRDSGPISTNGVCDILELGSHASDGPRRNKVARVVNGLTNQKAIIATGERSNGKRLYAFNRLDEANASG